jgi:hypothetical protein
MDCLSESGPRDSGHEQLISNGGRFKPALPKEINANRFFWDSHWLEIWSNHFCPSMGPNGGSVDMDSGGGNVVNHFLQCRGATVIKLGRKYQHD